MMNYNEKQNFMKEANKGFGIGKKIEKYVYSEYDGACLSDSLDVKILDYIQSIPYIVDSWDYDDSFRAKYCEGKTYQEDCMKVFTYSGEILKAVQKEDDFEWIADEITDLMGMLLIIVAKLMTVTKEELIELQEDKAERMMYY